MRKLIICFIGIFVMLFSFLACDFFGRKVFIRYIPLDDEETIYATGEELSTSLLISIENNDIEAFKSHFCDFVLTTEDYSNGEKYVFDTFLGKVQSIERLGYSTGDRFSPNEKSKHASISYSVITDEKEYVMLITFYTYYKQNSEYENKIYEFKILNKEGAPQTGYFSDMGQRYGIYYPGWLD